MSDSLARCDLSQPGEHFPSRDRPGLACVEMGNAPGDLGIPSGCSSWFGFQLHALKQTARENKPFIGRQDERFLR